MVAIMDSVGSDQAPQALIHRTVRIGTVMHQGLEVARRTQSLPAVPFICEDLMKEQALFKSLVQSLSEAKAIASGKTPASRRFSVVPRATNKPLTPQAPGKRGR